MLILNPSPFEFASTFRGRSQAIFLTYVLRLWDVRDFIYSYEEALKTTIHKYCIIFRSRFLWLHPNRNPPSPPPVANIYDFQKWYHESSIFSIFTFTPRHWFVCLSVCLFVSRKSQEGMDGFQNFFCYV